MYFDGMAFSVLLGYFGWREREKKKHEEKHHNKRVQQF
jgi:hypothetical protein